MSDKQLSGLSDYSQAKSEKALSRTEQAIAYIANNNQKITIRSVARKAGVSASYIYKHPELAYKIQKLREQQKYALVEIEKAPKNYKKQIETLKQEKENLELKNVELKAIIERTKTGKPSLKELKIENIQLATENIRLKSELEFTLESLQEARAFILEQGRTDFPLKEINTDLQ